MSKKNDRLDIKAGSVLVDERRLTTGFKIRSVCTALVWWSVVSSQHRWASSWNKYRKKDDDR
jgi:hypothetical protein